MSPDPADRRPRSLRPPDLSPGPLNDLKLAIFAWYERAGRPALDTVVNKIKVNDEVQVALRRHFIDKGMAFRDAGLAAESLAGATPGRDTVRRILVDAALPASRQSTVSVAVALVLLAREQQPGSIAKQIAEAWDRAAAGGVGPRVDPSGQARVTFDHLIKHHTRVFAGRDPEMHAVNDYINGHDRGYVLIDGLSGYGKTSLLAALVQSHPGFLLHFISQAYKPSAEGTFDPTRPEDLMTSLCRQLEPEVEVPGGRRELGVRFQEALRADRREPTVLVLDAIDEVNEHPSFLYGLLPQTLPRNLFIILSARSQGTRSYLEEIGLDPLRDLGATVTMQGLGLDAIHQLLAQHAGRAGAGLAERDQFVETLQEVSAGDPFYLRFLIEDVEIGVLTDQNIEQTPTGLDTYLDKQFEYLNRPAGTSLHAAVISCIVKATRPLNRIDLIRIQKADGAAIDRVLRDLQRFLLRTGPHQYTFCHNRFAEYFWPLV